MNQLQSEITQLASNPTKTSTQQAELTEKKKKLLELQNRQQELERLLAGSNKSNASESKDKGDRTGLYIGLGAVGAFLILGLFIFIRKHRKRPTKA